MFVCSPVRTHTRSGRHVQAEVLQPNTKQFNHVVNPNAAFRSTKARLGSLDSQLRLT